MSSDGNGTLAVSQDLLDQPDFLYAILNLPRTATEHEIRERYRNLSLVFHPDKQRDDRTRATASRRFLEIQKAYEVLSDPFTRAVYDVFGYKGLLRQWPSEWRSRSQDEVKELLLHAETKIQQETLENLIRSRSTLRVTLDGRSLFGPFVSGRYWADQLKERINGTSWTGGYLRQSLHTNVTDKLRLQAVASLGLRGRLTALGHARYQLLPKLNISVGTSLLHILRLPFVTASAKYEDDDMVISGQTTISVPPELGIPPSTLTFQRRLFEDSLTYGVLQASVGPKPSLSVELTTPTLLRLGYFFSRLSGPRSGPYLDVAVVQRSIGLTVAGLATGLRGGCGISFPALAAGIKLDLVYGLLTGVAGVLTGSWGDKINGVTTAVSLGVSGVAFTLDMCYLGQRLSIPVVLSDDFDPSVAAFASALPSAASVLVYHFLVKPRQLKERAKFFRAAHEAFKDEQSSVRREVENTIALLRDTARKHMQAEKAINGLVIVEGVYGPTESAPEARDLMVDVTIPLQSMVHKSQLYIPGRRGKSGLPGFFDPAPDMNKSLRVRYLFDDRMHYAELLDEQAVVLPLRDHLVDSAS